MGLTVNSNFLWSSHLDNRKDCLVSKCKRMLSALKFSAGGSKLSIKKRLVDAVMMSRIAYGIQLWGAGSSKSVVRIIQGVQNLSMCWITGSHRLTSTRAMLAILDWLSINQLIMYHGFLFIYKIRRKG